MQERKTKIVSFDFESTGKVAARDRVCQFAFIMYDIVSRETKVLFEKCKPGIPISEEAEAIHGISNKEVEDKPPFSHFVPQILEMLDGAVIAGQNIHRYDIPMLYYELKRLGVYWDWKAAIKNSIDTFQAHREFFPSNLDALHRQYAGKPLEGAHGAFADATGVIDIMLGMMKFHNMPTLEQMIQVSNMKSDAIVDFENRLYINSSGILCFNFGKYKDRSIKEIFEKDSGYIKWLRGSEDYKGYSMFDYFEVIEKELISGGK